MRRISRIQYCVLSFFLLTLFSCSVERPSYVISDAEMEKILYDYHIAKAMGEEVPHSENYKRLLYIESVYKKYNITQADFDSSMVWFTRNPEILFKIYEKVSERLKKEKEDISTLIAIRDNKPKESQPGDSINVWIWSQTYQLTGMPMSNKLTFQLPSDVNFQERDTLRWNVRFRFLNQLPDTLLAPVMAMQIRYSKDTLINSLHPVLANGMETITLCADTLGHIEEIRGFVYYPMQESAMRSLLIDSISLMRYHATDSLQIPSLSKIEKPVVISTKKVSR